MSEEPKGFLAVWMDVEPAAEEEFHAWYIRQHIPERVGVPGFLNGRRYEATSGAPRFLAVYDTESPAVLSSAPYLERLNDPTPWTKKVMPSFRNTVRAACRIVLEAGAGFSGAARALRFDPQPGGRERLREALASSGLEKLAGQPGVVRVCLAESVEADQPPGTAEIGLRGPDAGCTFVALVEGTSPDALAAACRAGLSAERLLQLGARPPIEEGTYRLLNALSG